MSSRVAWVTGATRGIGRGIAVALGREGWTVWVTGRSTSARDTISRPPGTVDEVADVVSSSGGRGIGRVCDHRDDEAVRAVAAEIAGEGLLDLLVNNVWGGYERLNAGAWQEWNAPCWEQPIELWDAMFAAGVRAHYVAAVLCAPLLRRTPGSLIVTVSMEAGRAHEPGYGVAYSVAKAADDRLALALAGQLDASGVTSVSLHPGLVRTEGVMRFADALDLTDSQSPEGVGRVVAALAADTDRHSLTGGALGVADLARRYGVDVTT